MKADLSRDTYRRQYHFARVLMQQGRVQLDADWNEQVSILLEQNRMLAADLIGPHGGPEGEDGFLVTCPGNLTCDFDIGWGRYYVDGIACELRPEVSCPPLADPDPVRYTNQPDYPFPGNADDPAQLQPGGRYLVYLDVWERHLNALQADHIREVALGGPDTAARSKVVCQVKAAPLDENTDEDLDCDALLDELVGAGLCLPRCLRARAKVVMPSDDPCLVPPTAQYRGQENQLYRVEIHDPGTAGGVRGQATFKWSRDNGSVVFGIRSLQGAIARLDSLGPDRARGLKEGDWVEVVDDVSELLARPRQLLQVEAIDRVTAEVTLAVSSGQPDPFDESATTHPLLRRWDQPSDVIPVRQSKWIDLEDGVQVWFEQGGDYKAGDYWQVPARTAIADVLWPQEPGPDGALWPKALPPRGIHHHVAPLCRIEVDAAGHVTCGTDRRCVFPSLCALAAGDVTPPPSERVEVLEPIVFEAGAFELPEDSGARAIANENASRLLQAAREGLRTVRLRSIATEEGEEGLSLGWRRAEAVRNLYVAAGVRADLIDVLEVKSATGREPRVETDMVLAVRAEPTTRDGGAAGGLVRVALTDVPGVGEISAERLTAAGIEDAAALARMDLDQLVTVLTGDRARAFSRTRAAEILRESRNLAEDH